MRYQNEQKNITKATVALVITSALVITIFCGKREMSVSRIMVMTNHEVGTSVLIIFNLTVFL